MALQFKTSQDLAKTSCKRAKGKLWETHKAAPSMEDDDKLSRLVGICAKSLLVDGVTTLAKDVADLASLKWPAPAT